MKKTLRSAQKRAAAMQKSAARRLNRPNLFQLSTAERVGVVFTAPSDMKIDERIFLYALVRGYQPHRALEIGVLAGGGGCIMANAMEENGKGVVIGVDPDPQLRVKQSDLHNRYKIVKQPSPAGLAEAREIAGGPFDFVLVDGLHTRSQVRLDIAGLLPFLSDEALILFHDAFHYGIASAIAEALESHPELIDCGYPCRTARIENDPFTPYNGFRMLRKGPKIVDVYDTVQPIYQERGKSAPPVTEDMLDHDGWYCRAISPCKRCVDTGRVKPKLQEAASTT